MAFADRLPSDAETAAGKPITAHLLGRLRDELQWIADGDAVADYPVDNNAMVVGVLGAGLWIPNTVDGEAKIVAGSVTNAKLAAGSVKWTNLDISTFAPMATAGTVAGFTILAGMGANGIMGTIYYGSSAANNEPQFRGGIQSGENAPSTALKLLNNTTDDTYLWLQELTGQTGATANASVFYVVASPPYDMGDGECGAFIYVRQAPGGQIIAATVCPDPAWPTSHGRIRKTPDGARVSRRRILPSIDDLRNPSKRQEALEAIRASVHVEEPVTPRSRCSPDLMARCPHPFAVMESGERSILLDPASDLAHQLLRLHREGEPVGILLAAGYLEIGDDLPTRAAPPGVPVAGLRWRNAGG